METNDRIKDRLAEFIKQGKDVENTKDFRCWIEENGISQKEYKEYLFIWENYKEPLVQGRKVNIDAAWENVNSSLSGGNKTLDKRKVLMRQMTWLSAATVALLIGLTFFLSRNEVEIKTFVAVDELNNKIELPDGSIVWLRKGAELTFPEKFIKENRDVSLKGGAYFSVSRDKNHPFIIQTPHSFVKVLGTSFELIDKEKNAEVTISVNSGKVSFKGREGKKEIFLEKGEKAILEKHTDKMSKISFEENNFLSWIDKKLVFEDCPLYKVALDIGNCYSVELMFKEKVDTNQLFTGEFVNLELEKIMQIVEMSTGAKLVRK